MKLQLLLAIILFSQICTKNLAGDILDNFENKPAKEVFKAWHYAFEKPYDLNSEIGLKRYKIFKNNLEYIKESNKVNKEYTLGLGPFTDLTPLEFSGYDYKLDPHEPLPEEPKSRIKLGERFTINDVDIAQYEKDELNPEWVNDLPNWSSSFKKIPKARRSKRHYEFEQCTTDASFLLHTKIIEHYMPKFGLETVELSRQNFFDCVEFFRHRCNDDFVSPETISRYVFEKGIGIFTEESYPTEKEITDLQECKKRDGYDYMVRTRGCQMLGSTCTIKTKREFLQNGPVLTYILSHRDLQNYKSGVLDARRCNQSTKRHVAVITHLEKDAVHLLFGYGKRFGDNGYVKMSRHYAEIRSTEFYRVNQSCGAESMMAAPFVITKQP